MPNIKAPTNGSPFVGFFIGNPDNKKYENRVKFPRRRCVQRPIESLKELVMVYDPLRYGITQRITYEHLDVHRFFYRKR